MNFHNDQNKRKKSKKIGYFATIDSTALTDKLLTVLSDGNSVVNVLVTIKMKGLKCVKQKISHIFVHVNTYDASIEIINNASTIHDLRGG